MKKVNIQADAFFEMLKQHDKSMWEIFAHMIDGTKQHICFVNEKDEVMFDFILPATVEDLTKVQEQFSAEFKERLRTLLN